MRQGRKKQNKVTESSDSFLAKLFSSTENTLARFQPGRHHQRKPFSRLVNTDRSPSFHLVSNTRDAPFTEVRCASRGTECLSLDSLFPVDSLCIGHCSTMNLERKYCVDRRV